MQITVTRTEAIVLRDAWKAFRTHYDDVAARIDMAISDDMEREELINKVSGLEMQVFSLEVELSDLKLGTSGIAKYPENSEVKEVTDVM